MDVKFPEDGYHGPDIIKFANKLKETYGDTLLEKPLSYFREIGIAHELEKIRVDLDMFRVKFDVYSHEVMLYEKGWVDEVIPTLKEKGYIYEKDDAVWFRTTDFEDDKESGMTLEDSLLMMEYIKDKMCDEQVTTDEKKKYVLCLMNTLKLYLESIGDSSFDLIY